VQKTASSSKKYYNLWIKKVSKEVRYRALIYILSVFVVLSCGSTPESPREQSGNVENLRQVSGGLAEEIRTLTETGVLSSMLQAMELIRSRELSNVDFGRMMNGINTLLIRLVYPDSLARLPTIDLPLTLNYTRIIREAERGNYVRPSENSVDFFEHILPFLAVNEQTSAELLPNILRDLEKAGELRPNSVLPPYFRGLIYERLRQFPRAEAAYRQAYQISNECYPAQVGIARIRRRTGNISGAAAILPELAIRFPDSLEIKREHAIVLYETRDWSRALPLIDEILQTEPRNGDFLLMRAFILTEQRQFSQANTVLDNYAPINPNNRLYLFLRARVQFEGNRNRDSALNYLRSILRSAPDDVEVLVYAAGLLLESARPADQAEGREMLTRLRQLAGNTITVLNLGLRDAVRNQNWQEAQGLLNRILATRRTDQDLIDGYHIERGLGNNARALSYASELYERNTSNNDYEIIFISALIDNNRRDEASRLLETRINSSSRGPLLSRYYFLRSRLQRDENAALSDLRTSLFEDPRNLDSLIAMFEIYHRRREERRAVHYLRQALAIAPDHPTLRRYEREYASLLR
jgi:tetratricopeptide (TPR) repeat protein